MRPKNIKFVLLLVLTGFISNGFCQSNYTIMGNKAYENKQFIPAIEYYTKALNKSDESKQERNEIIYKLADCYRLTNNPKRAENYYERLIKNNYADQKPEVYLHYANSLNTLGYYTEAIPYFDKYLTLIPNDKLALSGKASCEMSIRDTSQNRKWIIRNVKELNTTNDEFAAVYGDNKSTTVIFSSNRKGTLGKEKDNWTNGFFSDLFVASKAKDNTWEDLKLLDENERVNTIANEGTPNFDKKFKTLYFTRCEKMGKIQNYCQIYEADRSGATWTKPVVIYADTIGNAGHPAVSSNGLFMIFSSNRPGGNGGKDLWKATRTSERKPFAEPVNLGSLINTPGDEMFPTLVGDSVLYFASNGLPGFGGLDLFMVQITSSGVSNLEHLPRPVNSQDDDFAITFEPGNDRGFFTSRRTEGKGGDDIYAFEKIAPKIMIRGLLTDELTIRPIANQPFTFIHQKEETTLVTGSDGSFVIENELLKDRSRYSLSFSKENYFSKKQDITIGKLKNDTAIQVNVALSSIPDKPIVLPDIYYELDKWDILPQYQDSLMVLVGILNDNPNIVIELASHTDSRASDDYNVELSQKRAESVVNFLTEKGIQRERLTAKGYGERIPRQLSRSVTRDGFNFEQGTRLTESFINSIKDPKMKEAAYQLNRRTEFLVTGKNFK